MNGPRASIDNCGTCVYWELLNPGKSLDRGICKIITYPQEFSNTFAVIGSSGPLPKSANVVFVTAAGFHCTLYKVKR